MGRDAEHLYGVDTRVTDLKDSYLDALLCRSEEVQRLGLEEAVNQESEYLVKNIFSNYATYLNKYHNYDDLNHIKITLGEMFSAVAIESKHLMFSEVTPVLLSHKGFSSFDGDISDGDDANNIGVGKTGLSFLNRSSEIFNFQIPVLFLDDEVVEKANVTPDHPIISSLVSLVSAANHDYLHQWSHSSNYLCLRLDGYYIEKWRENNVHGGVDYKDARSYENWHILSHSEILRSYVNDGVSFGDRVEGFLSCLEGFSSELSSVGISEGDMHDVIDYLGMAGASALMKVVSLDHADMTSYLKRLMEIDPMPESIWEDVKRMDLLSTSPDAVEIEVKDSVNRLVPKDKNFKSALNNFRRAGDSIKTKGDDFGYLNLKRLQLASSNPDVANVYSPTRSWGTGDIKKAREVVSFSLKSLPNSLASQTGISKLMHS